MNKLRLFCLPYAGGSATIYNRWKNKVINNIIIMPVELQGRGKRFLEPLYSSVEQAATDIFNYIINEVDEEEYAIFGHSMGCLLSYEVARKIKESGFKEPIHIFFSGKEPPHIKERGKTLHTLPDEEFISEIYKKGGMPKEIFENKEILKIFTPILKADFKIIETYAFKPDINKLNYNISVLNGSKDDEISHERIMEWKLYTNKECNIYEFDGGHFFIMDKEDEVLKLIGSTLQSELLKQCAGLFGKI